MRPLTSGCSSTYSLATMLPVASTVLVRFFALATNTSTIAGLLTGAAGLTEAAFPSQAVTKAIMQAAPEQYSMALTKEILLYSIFFRRLLVDFICVRVNA